MLKTSIKSLALLAALFGTGELMAQTCNTNAWGVGLAAGQAVSGTPVPNSPTNGVSRYSGFCGLQSDAPADFVRDGSPNDEPTYIARFYVRPAITGGTAVVFQALEDGQATPSIAVSYTGTQLSFAARGATTSAVTVTPGAWYSAEVNWTAGGSMTYSVQGNAETAASTGTLTGVAAGAQVDQANLGWISGGTGGMLESDAFESRRTQPIGRLCRGDANNSGGVTASDRATVTAELSLTALGPGQPDCNESGSVSASDRACITSILSLPSPPAGCI